MKQGYRLSEDEVLKIRHLLETTDMELGAIAERMGCSRAEVGLINRRYGIRKYRGHHVWALIPKVILLALLAASPVQAEMSHEAAARRAARELGTSSNTYFKLIVHRERRFWWDQIIVAKCLQWDQWNGARMEHCAPTWELAFRSLALGQPVTGELP